MQGLQAVAVSLSMILIVVLIHHEVLVFVSRVFLPLFKTPRRWHVSIAVLILIGAHVTEILFCGLALFFSGEILQIGQLLGTGVSSLQSYLYFSFASYTSLGIGDIFPIGHLRLLTGIEALLGLLMIGWTASFLLLEMRTFWSNGQERQD